MGEKVERKEGGEIRLMEKSVHQEETDEGEKRQMIKEG
jgi:hypothetical protein